MAAATIHCVKVAIVCSVIIVTILTFSVTLMTSHRLKKIT